MSEQLDRVIDEALERAFRNGVEQTLTLLEHFSGQGYGPHACMQKIRAHFDLPQDDEQ